MNDAASKLVLITGASSGIGAACARRFAADGADLALWARREARLAELADKLSGSHGSAVRTAGVDVRDRAAVEAAAAELLETATPDILVNNAGLAAGLATVQEGDPDHWDRMIDTNVKGLLYVSRSILPAMIEAGRGHVINIGSIAGRQVYPMGNVYNATKFAVNALSQGMNLDVLGTPIRVSSIDPGHVGTEFARVRFDGDERKAGAVYDGFTPLRPEDVAETVAFVASRPPDVNITDVVMFSTAQRSANHIHRER